MLASTSRMYKGLINDIATLQFEHTLRTRSAASPAAYPATATCSLVPSSLSTSSSLCPSLLPPSLGTPPLPRLRRLRLRPSPSQCLLPLLLAATPAAPDPSNAATPSVRLATPHSVVSSACLASSSRASRPSLDSDAPLSASSALARAMLALPPRFAARTTASVA